MLTENLLRSLSGGDEEKLAELVKCAMGQLPTRLVNEHSRLIALAKETYGCDCDYRDARILLSYADRVKRCSQCRGLRPDCNGVVTLADFYFQNTHLRLNNELSPIPTTLKDTFGEHFFVNWFMSECRFLAEEMVQSRHRRSVALSGLPQSALSISLTSDQQKILSSFPTDKWLWLYGHVGSGKTLLISKVGARALELGQKVKFWNMPELLSSLRTEKSAEILSECLSTELLILDDIGSDYETEWTKAQIFLIVNGRYQRTLTTHFTSNHRIRDLARWGVQGMRTGDRILALGTEIEI